MSSLRVAFAGTPEFARVALATLMQSTHSLVGVLTQPDRPRGRGQHSTASVVKEAAIAAQLPVFQPANLRDGAALAELNSWRADVLVVVAYGQIVPQQMLAAPRLGCVNIHASLLPRWRGAAPIQRALLAGDTHSGVTIMRMEAGLDTGPILLQRSIPIGAAETSATLHAKLAELGAQSLLEALAALAEGTSRATPQPAQGVSYAAKIQKAEASIDWRMAAVGIDRQVRAFNPWPIAQTRFEGEDLRVFSAVVADGESLPGASAAGTILAVDDALVVQCGQGRLALTRVQRPGRRPISAREFAGDRDLLGRQLG